MKDIMVDELKPIDKSWLVDRIRFGERYLRDCIDRITNKNAFSKKGKDKIKKQENKGTKDGITSPYDGLGVSKEKPHSLDEEI